MFSISGLCSRSLGFCVAPVGTPPHLRKRFQISALYAHLLGTYKDTPIYIVDYPVETDEQAAMQEDVNVILQYLMEDPKFTINH